MQLFSRKILVPLALIGVAAAALFALQRANSPHPDVPATNGAAGDAAISISAAHRVLEEKTVGLPGLPVGAFATLPPVMTSGGDARPIAQHLQQGPVVLFFFGTKCPVARRYTGRLNRLHEEFSPLGVTIIGVNANRDDSPADVQRFAADMGYKFPVVKDADGMLARHLGATMTPQVFVVGSDSVLRYRGGIDDERYETRVKQQFLRNALVDITSAVPVAVPVAPSFGCTVHLPDLPGAVPDTVTFADHVAPILWNNCQPCHSPGNVAPMSLLTYEDAQAWSAEIAAYTAARIMPPWKAVPHYGEFAGSRRLSKLQIATLGKWAAQGAESGDLSALGTPPAAVTGWPLGEPDAILEMPATYTILPEGEDDYRDFVIPTDFGRDVYVRALDLEPGNRAVVHHASLFGDTSTKSRDQAGQDPDPGFPHVMGKPPRTLRERVTGRLERMMFWREEVPDQQVRFYIGGWLPGMSPSLLPSGSGTLLPSGADIVLQMHYYRTGKTEYDRSRVALYFAEAEDPVRVFAKDVRTRRFEIPPGATRHEVYAQGVFEDDAIVLGIIPHMHRVGVELQASATRPGKLKIPLVRVRDWDFNWQEFYEYEEPMLLPGGSTVDVTCIFDNSSANPDNPNSPSIAVRFGPKTTDEMCVSRLIYMKSSGS